jgi:hypothetical protein
MCSDYGAVDHMCLPVLTGQLGQRVQHGVEDTDSDVKSFVHET